MHCVNFFSSPSKNVFCWSGKVGDKLKELSVGSIHCFQPLLLGLHWPEHSPMCPTPPTLRVFLSDVPTAQNPSHGDIQLSSLIHGFAFHGSVTHSQSQSKADDPPADVSPKSQ